MSDENIEKKFEELLNSLSEEERKNLEQRLEGLDERTRDFFKTYVVIAKEFEEFEKQEKDTILEHLNQEELEKITKEELVLVLHDVIWQACGEDDGAVDSRALSAYAGAMRLLARLGLLEIESEYGRRVIGKLKAIETMGNKEP